MELIEEEFSSAFKDDLFCFNLFIDSPNFMSNFTEIRRKLIEPLKEISNVHWRDRCFPSFKQEDAFINEW